jgi:outer membrane protein OmpA-like peptidoglycan-associated protein
MSNIRAALSALAMSVAAGAGWQGPASAAGLPAISQPDSIWLLAQAQRRGEGNQGEEDERKGRRDRHGGERRDAQPRRADPPKDVRRDAKSTPDRRENDQSRRKEAPRIKAQPQPKIINTERRDARDERREDRKDAREDRREQRREVKEDRREDRKEVRDERRDAKEDRREDRKDARQERREDRRDAKQDRRDERRDAKEDRRDDRKDARIFRRLEDLKSQRRERAEDGGRRKIIEEADKRIIVREGNRMIIRHDETERFRRRFRDAHIERRRDGGRIARFVRPDGVHIISEYDERDRLLKRYRRHPDGRIVVIIDNTRHYHGPGLLGGLILGTFLDLAPPVIRIPREKYIVDYEDASYEDVYEALSAPPVDDLDRDYSLDEIRYNYALRDRMRRVDLDSINFEFGSWEVSEDQYYKLERIADAMNRLLDRNSEEVFLIEGYTDAVGSEEDNIILSDHRAEEVASILSEEFGVPAENLVTQGYGEQFLKIDTQGPERANRRVSVRRITPLLSRAGP